MGERFIFDVVGSRQHASCAAFGTRSVPSTLKERAATAALKVMPPSPVGLWPASVDWCDITLPTPAENLALDEILLQRVDANPHRAFLRTWEPSTEFVVVGRSNQVETEVNQPQCYAEGIPIFRRSSGGGAVVVGPGCLAFALAMPLTDGIRAEGISTAAKYIMQTTAQALDAIVPGITVCGISDLVVNDRKFSGNSQRWLKHAFLHHGTILYRFDLDRVGQLLKPPSRQPDYRSQRSHADFVTNLAALAARSCSDWSLLGMDSRLIARRRSSSRRANWPGLVMNEMTGTWNADQCEEH
jgi:lipoate-protein ligase A